MKITIVIPTYNRASNIKRIIENSLSQYSEQVSVCVIDDGSTDDTYNKVKPYFDSAELTYIKLAANCGTANAKNLGLLLADYEAVTFHDSDDLYDPNKIELQKRALAGDTGIRDPDSVWDGKRSGANDVVYVQHKFVRLDGKIFTVGWPVSLVDDFFPNIQTTTFSGGKFLLPNPGLFRKKVFEEMGGFLNVIEEDRELRDRLIAAGYQHSFINEPLITKYEETDSLTMNHLSGFKSEKRISNRNDIKRRAREMMKCEPEEVKKLFRVTINLEQIEIEFMSSTQNLTLNKTIPMTEKTIKRLEEQLMRESV